MGDQQKSMISYGGYFNETILSSDIDQYDPKTDSWKNLFDSQ